VHGYFAGGLILETGGDHQALNRVQCRATVNDAWQVAIFRPAGDFQPVSGKLEQQQFSVLSPATDDQRRELTDMAQRLVLAAQHNDFSSFVNLVQRYNRRSGLLFESVQGGPYNGHAVAELIDTLCERGARGVGQSSWGPGVFAWFESLEEAERFASGLPEGIETIAIARPQNNGRRLDLI
jgi:predicted sugar kinase